ncbi:MAG: DNA-binding response OmpR family regulator [Patiriisocius sp.]|jgi:DNA-binding response OmpR family regulator
MNILLIDDDAFLRDMYATKFTEKGDKVEVAQDGNAGLAILAEHSFDVVIVDMVMPGMSGLDFLNAVPTDGAHAKCKYIVLSNQGEDTDITAATKAGADGYIIKAESIPSEVVAKVHNIVS